MLIIHTATTQSTADQKLTGGFISNSLKNEHNTYYYADANNIISQIKQFRSDGAEDSQIIKDKVHAKLPERENYQKLKNRILQPGDTLTVCSLSVLESKYAARAELMYYREHHIRIRVLNMPATMQEFSENQEFLYDSRYIPLLCRHLSVRQARPFPRQSALHFSFLFP